MILNMLIILGIVAAFLVVATMAVMFFDMSGKALARTYEWFLRRF